MKKIDEIILQIISHAIGNWISCQKANKEKRMTDFSISSISMISILFEIEKKFGISITESHKNVNCSHTIDELIGYVKDKNGSH